MPYSSRNNLKTYYKVSGEGFPLVRTGRYPTRDTPAVWKIRRRLMKMFWRFSKSTSSLRGE
jgi:hypothetical protein